MNITKLSNPDFLCKSKFVSDFSDVQEKQLLTNHSLRLFTASKSRSTAIDYLLCVSTKDPRTKQQAYIFDSANHGLECRAGSHYRFILGYFIDLESELELTGA